MYLSLVPNRGAQRRPVFQNLLSDEKFMGPVFEEFIRNFYSLRQAEFRVDRTKPRWNLTSKDSAATSYLPQMTTDVTLRSATRTVIIDAKYYKSAFQTYQGSQTIHSPNLYQMMAYLHGTKIEPPRISSVEGILIYPVGIHSANFSYEIDGFPVRIFTLDLSQPTTSGIERDLLHLIGLRSPDAVESVA